MTRVKICGVTRPEDALHAADAGAHAIGLVFYADSSRCVGREAALEICAALPPFVTTVGLFVDPSAEEVHRITDSVPLHLLQFHGEEPPLFCGQFGVPYLKAVRVREGVDLLQYASRYASAKALLLDAFVEGRAGGTGQTFDWDLIPRSFAHSIILSGGLTPHNVGAGVCAVRPWAVDVSSGVEAAPGIKDPRKIAAFMEAIRNADAGT
jgi:phosphoribosylanthranilate isomerase